MKKMMSSILLLSCFVLFAKEQVGQKNRFNFIDMALEDFMQRMEIPSEEREAFKNFYTNVLKNMQSSNEKDQRSMKIALQDKGWSRLQHNHKQWYDVMNPYLTQPSYALDTGMDPVRKTFGSFCMRMGIYDLYMARIHGDTDQKMNFIDSVFAYASSAKDSVLSWLGLNDKKTHLSA